MRVIVNKVEPVKLKSWDDVGLNLKEIGESKRVIEKAERDLNEKISDLKLEAALVTKPHNDKIAELEKEIQEYAEANKHFITGKSINVGFGKVGFRKSTKLIIEDIKDCLKRLKARKMDDCIKIKYEEKIDSTRLKEYKDDVIESVGAVKETKDIFYYELDNQKL